MIRAKAKSEAKLCTVLAKVLLLCIHLSLTCWSCSFCVHVHVLVCVCVRVRKDVHMFFHSFCVSVCNVSRTPGSVAGARLIAASQLAHDVSQPGSK